MKVPNLKHKERWWILTLLIQSLGRHGASVGDVVARILIILEWKFDFREERPKLK